MGCEQREIGVVCHDITRAGGRKHCLLVYFALLVTGAETCCDYWSHNCVYCVLGDLTLFCVTLTGMACNALVTLSAFFPLRLLMLVFRS